MNGLREITALHVSLVNPIMATLKPSEIYKAFVRDQIQGLFTKKYASEDEAQQTAYASSLKDTLSQLDDDTLAMMLSAGKDHELMASWLIGLGRRKNLTQILGESILLHPLYVDLYCFSLARMLTLEAKSYLKLYLGKYMIPDIFMSVMRWHGLSINSAIIALEYMQSLSTADEFNHVLKAREEFAINSAALTTATGKKLLHEEWVDRWSTVKFEQNRTWFREFMDFAQKYFD